MVTHNLLEDGVHGGEVLRRAHGVGQRADVEHPPIYTYIYIHIQIHIHIHE